MNHHSESSIRDEILGRLSAEQLEVAAERILLDESYYQATIAEEEHLIEDYVCNLLSPSDKADFERQCLLRKDLRDRTAIYQAARSIELEKIASTRWRVAELTQRSAPVAWRMTAWAAAAMVLVTSGVAIYLLSRLNAERQVVAAQQVQWQQRERELQTQVSQLAGEVQELKALDTPRPGDRKPGPNQPPEPQLLAGIFRAQPDARGGLQQNVFPLPAGRGRVNVQFVIGFDLNFSSYRITIADAGAPVLDRSGLQPVLDGNLRLVTVTVPVPAKRGTNYGAILYGRDAAGLEKPLEDYHFAFSTR